jgi:hypothetical protein
MVAGWYADLGDDPLAQLLHPASVTAADVLATIQQTFGWTFAPAHGASPPGRIICNGLITGIGWDPQRRYLIPPSSKPITVAIGNTTAEALSAYLAARLPDLGNVEGLLNALQLGQLNRLGQPDGPLQIEEALHQSQFGSLSAGTVWSIRPKTPPPGSAGSLDGIADRLRGTLPEELGDALNQLNLLQAQANALQFQIDAARAQIFADWYKYMLLEYGPQTLPIRATDALNYVRNTGVAALERLLEGLQTLTDRLHAQLAAVSAAMRADTVLGKTEAHRFWAANDPVILLAGEDLASLFRPTDTGSFDASGNLICRMGDALVSGLRIPSASEAVNPAQLPQLPASRSSILSAIPELAGLMAEAFFLDPNQCWVLARAAAGAAAGDLWQQIQAAQRALFSGGPQGDVIFSGSVPAPLGFQTWAAPFVPLLLEWEVEYYPLAPIDDQGGAAAYAPGFITANFALDQDAIDLAALAPPPAPAQLPPVELYRGIAPLAHNVEIDITGQIDAYLRDYPDDPQAAELKKIAAAGAPFMMAQALGGFHQALIMRKQTLQLPVADPLAATPALSEFSNVTVQQAVGRENTTAPLPDNPYNPLRAALMRVRRLWLVDMFGQKRELVPQPTDVIRAASLVPHGEDPAHPFIALPPRISQPSRLRFRWLSADNDAVEMNSDPATTPVCGWVLFNHLDDNLMIYDGAGRPLGSLNARGPLWTGAPGDNATYDQPIGTVLANANAHLRAFALGIHDNPDAVDFLTDLLTVIDDTLALVGPQNGAQSAGLSVLIGRPLALVRASLRLDLQGSPALNESWAAFIAAVQDGLPADGRDTAAFPTVRFPVRLGDLANLNDGLIGYFIDDGSAAAYRTCYAPASRAVSHGVVPPGPNQLTVAGAAAPVIVTMLIDPHAAVHATAGIVPVKQIGIPPYMYADAMRRMAVTFLTTPVLSAAARFSVPIPNEAGYGWSWVTRQPGSAAWQNSPIAPANPNAADFPVQQISEGWLRLTEQPPTRGDN